MSSMLALLLLCCSIQIAFGVDSYAEKCAVTEGAGIRVDSCDVSKFLTCQSTSRKCGCQDEVNQLWNYRYAPQSPFRSRRSPKGRSKSKGSKPKPILVVGGGTYIGHSAGNNDNNKEQNGVKVFACYGRVGSPCLLDYNHVNFVTTSTTTEATTTTRRTDNATRTTEKKSDSTSLLGNLKNMPKCVRNAFCVRQSPSKSGTNGAFKTGDPRIGKCGCGRGYKTTHTGQCVQVETSSSGRNAQFSLFLILTILLIVSAT